MNQMEQKLLRSLCSVRSFSQLLQLQFFQFAQVAAQFLVTQPFKVSKKLRNATHFARTRDWCEKKTELAQELTINKRILIFSPIQLIF